ncbi:hypothetical protein GQ457_06G006720 [Hibiscus cannabinus]
MSLEDFLQNPDCWCRHLSEKDARVKVVWLAPPVGTVKFNTDGAVKGGFGIAGIGGVLRDATGKEVLITFSSFDCDKEITLQVECDCSNVVSWLRQPFLSPFAFKDLVAQCLGLARNLKWELLLVNREMNTRADRLAKAGIECE